MKKILYIIIWGIFALSSCKEEFSTWEYKIVCYDVAVNDFSGLLPSHTDFHQVQDSLNTLGQSGWELMSSFVLTGTSFPNFGSEEYHTGIKEQVATRSIQFILKRKINGSMNDTKRNKDYSAFDSIERK